MNDRQTVYYYVGLAVLCLMVVVAVVYYVKPHLETPLPSIPQPPADTQGGSVKPEDPYGVTLRTMTKGEDQPAPQQGDSARNPFLLPGEMDPKKQETPPPEPKSVPKLGMIIVGAENRIASLDQELVYEGNMHAGFLVEKIAPRAVTLSNVYYKLQLIAPTDHFGPAEVKRVERSRP
jgi:hypothetical protein